MKFEWKLIVGSAVFLGVVYAIYWFTSYEDAGSVMLLFSACAYLMLGSFLLMQWRRRKSHPRPEDDPRADQTPADLGFFPSASIWPAGIGLGAIFIGFALIWGNWYFLIALPLILGSIIGFSVEAEAGFDAVEEAEAHHQAEEERLTAEGGGDRRPV